MLVSVTRKKVNLGISLPALLHTFTLSSIKCYWFQVAFHTNHYGRGWTVESSSELLLVTRMCWSQTRSLKLPWGSCTSSPWATRQPGCAQWWTDSVPGVLLLPPDSHSWALLFVSSWWGRSQTSLDGPREGEYCHLRDWYISIGHSLQSCGIFHFISTHVRWEGKTQIESVLETCMPMALVTLVLFLAWQWVSLLLLQGPVIPLGWWTEHDMMSSAGKWD